MFKGRRSALAVGVGIMALCAAGQHVYAAPVEQVASVQSNAQTYALNIPSQPLKNAVEVLANRTGQSIAVPQDLANVYSTSVQGTLTADEALAVMVTGTGASWTMDGSGKISLIKLEGDSAMALAPVMVQGKAVRGEVGYVSPAYAGGQLARETRMGILGTKNTNDVPMSVSSYTNELAENLVASTVGEVLEVDPSVRLTTSPGHFQENFQIRGAGVGYDDMAVNGVYGMAPTGHAPMEMLERVEVLRGPSAMLSGMSPGTAVSGAINLVPKRASDVPINNITAEYSNSSGMGLHADVGRRYGTDGKFGVRVNLAGSHGETLIDDGEKTEKLAILAADYRGEKFRAEMDAYYMHAQHDQSSPYMVAFNAVPDKLPSAPDGTVNLFRGADGEQATRAIMTRLEYDVTDDWTAHLATGYKDVSWEGLMISTHARPTNPATGNFTTGPWNYRLDYSNTWFADTGVRGEFTTGPVKHQLAVNANRLFRRDWKNGVNTNTGGNIYDDRTASFDWDSKRPTHSIRDNEVELMSFGIADTLSVLDERLALTLGVRRQTASMFIVGDDKTNEKTHLSPMAAVVVKPLKDLSLYANVMEGLGVKAPSLVGTEWVYHEPEVTRSYEVGAKYDTGLFQTSVAIFKVENPKFSSSSMLNGGTALRKDYFTDLRGVELMAGGQLTSNLRLLGGITYTDSEVTWTNDLPQYVGNEAFGTPTWTGNLLAEYDVAAVPGLTVTGKAIYTGEQWLDYRNQVKVEDWWRLDVGARYTFPVRDTMVTVRGVVENVMNDNYWYGAFSDGYLTVAEPRTYKISTTVGF